MNEPLTAEKIAQCARVCARNPFYKEFPKVWTPDFNSKDDEDRSEALAIVEWLADAIKKLPDRESIADNIMFAVRRKDTTALMAMVLELEKS